MPDASDPKSRIDPQLAAALRQSQEMGAAFGPPKGIADVRANAAKTRKFWNEGGPEVADVREEKIPGPLRDIPVVVYRPNKATNLPAIVYLHGGGWKIGNEWANDRQMRELATAWGGVCISADYAHVPEHVFPAPVDETMAVYKWVSENGTKWGIDGKRLAFGGSSAGANVAMGAAIGAGGLKTGYLKAGISIVGALDTNYETASMNEFGIGANALYPPKSEVVVNAEQYATTPAHRQDPRFNCIAADPAILPPIFFGAAELDPLRDSSKNMAAKLAAAGRPHRLKVYPGMTHLYFGFTKVVDRAAECGRDIATFLSEHLPAK
jgi:acetyl esterase